MLATGIALYLLMGFDDQTAKFYSSASEREKVAIATDMDKKKRKGFIPYAN